MQIGPFFIGWRPLSESDRVFFRLDPWPGGWEVLFVGCLGREFSILARPRDTSKIVA